MIMVMLLIMRLIMLMLIIYISIHHAHGDVTHNEVDHGNGHLPQALLQVVLLLLQLLDPLLVAQLHPGHGGVMIMMMVMLMMLTSALMMTDDALLAMVV